MAGRPGGAEEDRMAEYSEATRRVFERSLTLLEDRLPAERVAALRALLAEGRLDDLDALEAALDLEEAAGAD
jgi:hypothetical protein